MSIYESTPVEPPTDRLIAALQARGIRVMVPITLPDLDLDWAEAGAPGPPLGTHAIGEARVVFLPALSVDRSGTRLGQGGGCYDRAIPRAPGARLVALVHPWEVREERLPLEPTTAGSRRSSPPRTACSHWPPDGTSLSSLPPAPRTAFSENGQGKVSLCAQAETWSS